MSARRPVIALYDCVNALPARLTWTGDERARWLKMMTATVDALVSVQDAAAPPTPPPTDADAGAFVEAVDELAAMVGSPFGEHRARRRVLDLYAAAVARAEAAEAMLDAVEAKLSNADGAP